MQVSRSFVFVAAVAAGLSFTSSADSWYWNGTSAVNDSGTTISYGKSVQASINWVNAETGQNGIPANGDIAIFDTKYANSGNTIGADVEKITFGGLIYNRRCDCNQSTVTLQAGGTGVQILGDCTVYWNSQLKVTGTGDFPVHVAYEGQELQIQKNFIGAAGQTLVKTGPGAINVFCNGYSSRTYTVPTTKLQGGTFKISQYDGNVSTGHEFWFDSNDADLRLHLFYKRDGANDYGPERYGWVIKDGAIRESAAVQNHEHEIYSTQTNLLTFTGTPTVNPMIFTGRFTGNAGLKWAPSTASEFVFSGGASTTCGKMIVSNGTVRVANGASFSSLEILLVDGASSVFAVDGSSCCNFSATSVTLANGGKLDLASGARVCARSLTVDGDAVPDGVYSGEAGADATVVDWLSGAGVLRVGELPEGSAAATWTFAGTGDISAPANWDGNVTPELGGGTTAVTVASSVGSTAVTMTLDRDVWLRGIDAQHKSWVTVSGSKQLGLGSQGIKTAASSRAVVQAPTELRASQEWTVRNGGGMEVKASVASYPDVALTVGGSGWIDWTAACPNLWGPLTFTNLTLAIKGSGTLGPAGAGPVYIYNPGDAKSATYVNGTVIDRDLWLTDCSKAAGSGYARITVPDNATLTFNGTVCSSNTTTLALTLGRNSTVIFNKLFMSRNAGSIQNGAGGGKAIFNGPYHNRDRFTMTGGTLEFHTRLNRMNGNMGTWSGGTVKLMTDYALEASNQTRRQPDATTGNSADAAIRTWVNPKGSAVLDLCGHDQSVDHIALHGGGGTVTSEGAATLHVIRTSNYWANHNYTQGFSVPSGYSSADSYGYECADRGFWTGGVTLKYECSNPAQRFMMRTSSSTGNVEVVSGTLVFLRRAKTTGETFDLKLGSANPFPRQADDDGAWTNATKAVVKGGVLKLEHGKAFGKETAFELNSAGKLQLEAGVRQSCASLTLNGEEAPVGTYGSTESDAQYKDDAYFTGKGVLKVGKIGIYILIR